MGRKNKNIKQGPKLRLILFLVFDEEDENQQYHFAANSEAEYQEWNNLIKSARYAGLNFSRTDAVLDLVI